MNQEDSSVQVNALSGVLHLFAETGTEGGSWAFQDERYIRKNVAMGFCKKCGKWLARQEGRLQVGRVTKITAEIWQEYLRTGKFPEEVDCPNDAHEEEISDSWSYEGLHSLRDGDFLQIFSPDDQSRVVWQGVISLIQYDSFTEHAFGHWIHSDQQGVPREMWAEWFLKGYPAKLIPAPRVSRNGE